MKNVPNRTKIVQGKKKIASVAHYGIELPCLIRMAICGLVWPYVVLMLLFTAMTICGLIRIITALSDLVVLVLLGVNT